MVTLVAVHFPTIDAGDVGGLLFSSSFLQAANIIETTKNV